MQTNAPRRDLPRLTSLRAFAAFFVFMFHIGHDTRWGVGTQTFSHGFVGVGFFYILSGFVLTWSMRPTTSPKQFWFQRFARIYPAYFATFLVCFVLPRLTYPITPAAILTNIVMIQAWFPQRTIAFGMNGVSWSLSCEAFFYFVAPFAIKWAHKQPSRRVTIAFGSWSAICALVALAISTTSYDVYGYTNPLIRSGEFFLGITVAILVIRGAIPRIPTSPALIVLLVITALTTTVRLKQSAADVYFELPFAALVAASATTDLARKRGPLTWKPLIYAGQVSYCFYLVHELVILNGELLWGNWAQASKTHGLTITLLCFALAFLIASALHHLIELPAQKALRSWSRNR